MGITNWIKFNENLNENFTREMAQEILYFFNTYHQDRKLSELFFKKPEIETGHHFDMYETGYDEINQMISRLLNLWKTGTETFKSDMIHLYNEIRKKREKLPHIYEIEDLFLNFLESNDFDFYVDFINDGEHYQIRICSKEYTHNIKQFNQYCEDIVETTENFSFNNCKMQIKECAYNYIDWANGGLIDFKIIIK